MKQLFSLVACVIIIVISACSPSQKTSAEKATSIKALVDSQRYIFTAQSLQPMGGRTRQLTSGYNLRITPDTINCYLPYFGTAFSASIDPSGGGIKFNSTNFDYNSTTDNRGGWEVKIKPKDAPGYQQVSMSIFNNGTATVKVITTDRQAISYNGFIDSRAY